MIGHRVNTMLILTPYGIETLFCKNSELGI